MSKAQKIIWGFFLIIPLFVIGSGNVFGLANEFDTDDELPEITVRVARISYIKGEAQIRRADSDDWEKVTKNLPIVEGDEIVTDEKTRIEIQFDKDKYLRLDEKAYLKLTTLRDEGIAVSLSEGSLNLRLLKFDKEDHGYFEIDAPQTTIAVQKAGMYRIDAGDDNYTVVQINVTEGGQAKIYSTNAGFTLNDGRRARVFTEGEYAGEWDLDNALSNMDSFDTWSLERDETIAKLLRKSHYDKYYDRDIYGAEDLSEYGEWINAPEYGYIWRPYDHAISSYSDWSPYRYGSWRWIEPFGWTWVNDEPWGWATYHHGRWIYYNNHWAWCPYPQARPRRSWWRPALVIIASIGSDVYWCPLPYDYRYSNYNRHRRDRRRNNSNPGNGTKPDPPFQTPTVANGRSKPKSPAVRLPVNGVVTVAVSDFGRGNKKFLTAPTDVAKVVLKKSSDEIQTPPLLPTFKDLNGNVSTDILVKNPKYGKSEPRVTTGATDRQTGVSLDDELKKQRIYGNRSPVRVNTPGITNKTDDADTNRRGTGAVTRPQRSIVKRGDDTKTDEPPVRNTQKTEDRTQSPPLISPPIRREEPRKRAPEPKIEPREEPKSEPPPQKREEPRYEPPQKRREEPKYEPPPQRREEPKYEPPPQRREEPKYEPPPKREEPKPDPPPSRKVDPKIDPSSKNSRG